MKLDRFDPRVIGCRIALELPHRHAHHGEHYRVRIDITVPGGEVVAARVPDPSHKYEDLHAAIDAAFDDAARQLQDFVRRQRGEVKPRERARRGIVTKLFPYDGYGFLRTLEGDELYFHRNAVLAGGFDRLRVNARVRFVEDVAESGPHASTVALISQY
jgi:cold shock CspA family protein/ribosome-associated translation inhibitor RaiA